MSVTKNEMSFAELRVMPSVHLVGAPTKRCSDKRLKLQIGYIYKQTFFLGVSLISLMSIIFELVYLSKKAVIIVRV